LKVGTIVVTLRPGFCGGAGELRKVEEICVDERGKNYALLVSFREQCDRKSLLYEQDRDQFWWKDVAIIDFEYYESLKFREREKYLSDLTAMSLF
jgi:hypothetical protein